MFGDKKNENIRAVVVIALATILLVAVLPRANAQDAARTQRASPWQWLEGQRDQISRNVNIVGRGIDDWLAGEVVGQQWNESYLRIELNQQVSSLNGYNSKFKVGGRLDLPNTTERWKLIFESDVDELNSLSENVLDNTQSDISVGGFRFIHETDMGWDFSHDIGLRARLPVDAFYRFGMNYRAAIDERWTLGLRQKFWYYDTKGWGYDTRVSFDRPLDPSRVFRIGSRVKFRDDNNLVEFAQSLVIHRTLHEMETISYELGVLGVNKPNIRINDYYIQMRHRKAIHEDWLIMELVPQLMLSRDENWRPEPRILFNLEVLFFDF
jgi:hypothetical protein